MIKRRYEATHDVVFFDLWFGMFFCLFDCTETKYNLEKILLGQLIVSSLYGNELRVQFKKQLNNLSFRPKPRFSVFLHRFFVNENGGFNSAHARNVHFFKNS